jgi:hypothetical protein
MLNNVTNQWLEFTDNSYFYQTGHSNSDLTVLSDLFMNNTNQVIWMIELAVFISSRNVSGYSSIILYVNFPPKSGTCDIIPTSGTTETLFTLKCYGWIDPDGSLISFAYYGNILIFENKNLQLTLF